MGEGGDMLSFSRACRGPWKILKNGGWVVGLPIGMCRSTFDGREVNSLVIDYVGAPFPSEHTQRHNDSVRRCCCHF